MMNHVLNAGALAAACIVFAVPALADERSPEMARSVAAYDKAQSEARDGLLKDFDSAIERLSTQTFGLTVEDRLKLIDVVKAEKERFEQRGLIPWSLPMRSYLAAYERKISGAESQLRRVYDQAINKALQAKADDRVNELRADVETVLQPRVVATWVHRVTAGPRKTNLYSNGRIDAVDAAHVWSFRNGVLTLVWKSPRAPGGIFRDVCTVAPDGSTYSGFTYTGENKRGGRIGGDFVAE
jgi:hypothetical protein